uniref:Bcl-2 Bcl-2 homology region 1-3 domain-containing protein n=1 Tax=Oreochromis aureus TaxID=47969 RepID=A0AAZ1XFA2_OREAU
MALTATFASKDTFAEAAVVADVAREIYSDGLLNWGRLVSLVAFGAALLGVSKASPERARNIGVTIAAYMTDTHMDWFVDNGGWVRSVPSSTLANTSVITFNATQLRASLLVWSSAQLSACQPRSC